MASTGLDESPECVGAHFPIPIRRNALQDAFAFRALQFPELIGGGLTRVVSC